VVITNGQSRIDCPEKLATLGTQDEDKQNINTTQYIIQIIYQLIAYNVDVLRRKYD